MRNISWCRKQRIVPVYHRRWYRQESRDLVLDDSSDFAVEAAFTRGPSVLVFTSQDVDVNLLAITAGNQDVIPGGPLNISRCHWCVRTLCGELEPFDTKMDPNVGRLPLRASCLSCTPSDHHAKPFWASGAHPCVSSYPTGIIFGHHLPTALGPGLAS